MLFAFGAMESDSMFDASWHSSRIHAACIAREYFVNELSATISLRPTRIALLVRPTDLSSIRRFMRICTCLWGGAYNPIIPVFRNRPRDWRPDMPDSLTGAQIARGYVEFFEPDVFVEAEPDLLERIGLDALRKTAGLRHPVIPLKALLACREHRDWSELAFGLGITDVLMHVHESEQRFQLREPHSAYLVKRDRGTGLVEAVFGLYPTDSPSSYFARTYEDVFKPTIVEATPKTWIKVYKEGGVFPLGLTAHGLERQPTGRDDPKYFVFDPAIATDLIDLWNLRLEPRGVIPVPLEWWSHLAGEISKHVAAVHRPLQGNPHGVMHRTTVEFARSIAEDRQRACIAMLDPPPIGGSLVRKPWRTPVWEGQHRDSVEPARLLRITAQEKMLTLAVTDRTPPSTEFATLSPDFASLYGGHQARWINVVRIFSSPRTDIATVLPLNVTNAAWSRMDLFHERVVVGTEGWSFPQRYKDSTQTICLLTQEDAVVTSLKDLGVSANLSDAGQIAKQVLQHLRGLSGLGLLAYPETLRLLNDMAAGSRKRNQDEVQVEEVFDPRTRSERRWKDHLAQRRNHRPLATVKISSFTDRNVIRLGLTTKCPRCAAANWHSLTTADYVLSCERCLEKYPFPQGALKPKNGNWRYRAIGPFATPDFARGSYGALLALKTLKGLSHASERMTYSTALELHLGDGPPCEVDYAAWVNHRTTNGTAQPSLVFGEAKSFGEGDLIKPRDLTQLRRIASRFPGAVVVISVMRDEFTPSEIRNLLPFVKWARKLNARWLPRNPVVLLTGVELFHEITIETTWKDRGGRYEKFADYDWTRSLHRLAEATQVIYLDLPFFGDDQRAAADRRRRRLNR